MIFTTQIGSLVDAAGGALIAALGIWVLTLKPRSRATVALGSFCGFAGVGWIFDNVFNNADPLTPDLRLVGFAPSFIIASIALIVLAASFPRPLERSERASFWGLNALAVTWAFTWVFLDRGSFPVFISAGDGVILPLAYAALPTALLTAVVFLALRFKGAAAPHERRQAAIVATALVLWPGYLVGARRVLSPDSWAWKVDLGIMFASALLWLLNTTRGTETRAARNVALACLAVPLVGAVAAVTFKAAGGYGVMRLITVTVLAYAILQHQVLGMDVRARWTISKSTVAAAFIAVFFIASEAAQQFFGETLGSTYVGIAAAGALVFAMAPLQRVAEKLAAKAVPAATHVPVAGPASDAADRREKTFIDAVMFTLRDGHMSREEELHLARLAIDLGIRADRAVELRHEVELARTE